MKLLTRAERDVLEQVRDASDRPGPQVIIEVGPGAFELVRQLREQGRVRLAAESAEECEGEITSHGREALRLWPLLVEKGLVAP